MPLYFHKLTEEFQLGIWRMDESLEALHQLVNLKDTDQQTLAGFKSEYRKHEWLTTRVLVKQLLSSTQEVTISYNTNGKPRLVNSGHSISISHTKNFVAVLLSKHVSVGIDLETIRPGRIEKIAKKFVTIQEENFIVPEKKILYQHVIWGTKEVLFKIYSKGELHFLKNLSVKEFKYEEKGRLTGAIEKENVIKEYDVYYEKLYDLMLVYAMGN